MKRTIVQTLLALSAALLLAPLVALRASEPVVKLAVFDVDATPPVGSAMAYDPVRRLDELTLRCRGIVLLPVSGVDGDRPIVLCAVDWIGIANEGHDAFRDALAEAAGTTRDRVAVHTLHQHDAPGCDFTAERIVRELRLANYRRFDGTFHRQVIQRAAAALRSALSAAQPVTHYGWGVAEVKEVASNRRILGADGRVRAMRYTATKDPALRAEPEGVIDPQVSLLSFFNGDRPLAVLSYYACHPQSYYRTGVPSPDFPGIARFIRGQAVPEALHVHFNGAGGNIGAGKYNDGGKENRMLLALRLAEGMKQAWTATQRHPLAAGDLGWQTVPVRLPVAPYLNAEKLVQAMKTQPDRGYIAEADQLAWLKRCQSGRAIDVSCLHVGAVRVLHMPGELFVEYQLAAKAMRRDLHVAMAAYGDYGPGYIGTARAYREGGYETSAHASNVDPKAEQILTDAMRRLLEAQATTTPKTLGTFHELPLEYRHTEVSGKLEITVSDPFIVSSRIARPELGAHEQPHLFKLPNGDIILVFHKDRDINGATRVILKSADKGKTWTPLPTPIVRLDAVGALRDGTVLFYDDYAFRKEGNVFVGQMCASKDGGWTFGPLELAEFHRRPDVKVAKAAAFWDPKDLGKYQATSARWSDELCHALWRSVLEKPDGTLIACAHTSYRDYEKAVCVCYHSTDKGRTWRAESTIAAEHQIGGEGFVEPVMALCSNGDVLCVMRDGLWQARSTDGGKTWGKYETLSVRGVDPDLCLMSNGVLACSHGRPGNRIMFSADGTGREWADRLKIYEYRDGSFGYTGIVEVEPEKLLFVYDRRDAFPEYDGKQTTAIQGVYITVHNSPGWLNRRRR